MVEIAALIAAVAFAALVVVLISVLLRLRTAIDQTERLLLRLNAQLSPVLADIENLTARMRLLVDQARGGVDQVTLLLDATGRLGRTLQQAQHYVQHTGTSMFVNVASAAAGLKAAWDVIKERTQQQQHNGGYRNGGQL